MSSKPPLAGSYGARCALVLLALCPNIVVTTAVTLMVPSILPGLGADRQGVQLAEGLSNAGYAFGAVLAAAALQRIPLRRGLLAAEGLFVAGSALVAAAPGITAFTAGRVLQGFATGMLLVFALPPLVTGFPVRKLPVTVAVVNVGLFGAVTAGPLVGGYVGAQGGWRWFFAGLAALGVSGFAVGHLSVEHAPPNNPQQRIERTAIVLAAAGTMLPFFGVSELVTHPFLSAWVLPPMALGIAAVVGLILVEYYRREPLMPMRLLAHTFPVTGVLAAMVAGAGFVALLTLAEQFLTHAQQHPPTQAGLLFWPMLAGLIAAAGLFGALFRTRWVPVLVLAGMLTLAAAAGALLTLGPGSSTGLINGVAAALGFGAGATVSPGLFLAALAVPSSRIGTVFALVELLRAEAAYLIAPVLLHVAMRHGHKGPALTAGITEAVWVCLALLLAATLTIVALFRLGRARLHAPDLAAWVDDGDEALDSPPVAAALRQ